MIIFITQQVFATKDRIILNRIYYLIEIIKAIIDILISNAYIDKMYKFNFHELFC